MSEIFLGSESFLGTIVMFGSAVIGMWISSLIQGLDILGYVSTIFRDSPYVSTLGNESTIDGTERSRKYGSMKLKLVDTEDDDKKGHIAIAKHRGFRRSYNRRRLYN
jgi:hypothetical protein